MPIQDLTMLIQVMSRLIIISKSKTVHSTKLYKDLLIFSQEPCSEKNAFKSKVRQCTKSTFCGQMTITAENGKYCANLVRLPTLDSLLAIQKPSGTRISDRIWYNFMTSTIVPTLSMQLYVQTIPYQKWSKVYYHSSKPSRTKMFNYRPLICILRKSRLVGSFICNLSKMKLSWNISGLLRI